MRYASFLLCALLALSGAAFADPATGTERSAPPATSSAIYVTISGPTDVATHWTCNWYAFASGGTAPYTFHWSETGMVRDESYSADHWRGRAVIGGNVGLSVQVTDANGQSAWGHLVINSDNNAPFCID